jgi:hypothetical protein
LLQIISPNVPIFPSVLLFILTLTSPISTNVYEEIYYIVTSWLEAGIMEPEEIVCC